MVSDPEYQPELCPTCAAHIIATVKVGAENRRLRAVLIAAAAILHPARADASWLHTSEFDDLRAAVEACNVPIGPVS